MGKVALSSLALVMAVAYSPLAFPCALALLALPVLGMALVWPRWRAAAVVTLIGALALITEDARLAARVPRALDGTTLELVGTVDSLPDLNPQRARFELAVVAGPLAGRRLAASWYTPSAAPQAGERWRFRLQVRRPRAHLNPGAADLEAAWFERGIDGLATVRDGVRLAPAGSGLLATRAWFAARIDTACARLADACGVVAGLAVGRTAGIPDQTWRALRRTGTVHLIAISGLHVTLLGALAAGLAVALVRRRPALSARVPAQIVGAAVGLLVATGYAALAGASLPTRRTVLMLAVVAAAALLRRPAPVVTVLSAALLAVLATDPFAVLAPGFWLSFAGVAVLALGNDARHGPWLAPLAAQRNATLGLAPLLLIWFGAVPLVAPLVNLLAIPLFNLVLVPLTLFGCALAAPLPTLADACFIVVAQLVDWCVPWLTALGAASPMVTADTRDLVAAGGALIGTLWLLVPPGLPARWCGAVLWLPLLLAGAPLADGEFDAVVLDVGHGLAVIVTTRTHTLLYDTGPAGSDGDAASWSVDPALAATGRTLDGVVVSHRDRDHAGGAVRLSRENPEARWWAGADVPIAAAPCRRGANWTWDGVRFEFLHPGPAGPLAGNDGSCVLRVTSRAGSLLLPGDIESAGEEALLDSGNALRVDALIAPHHGSASSSGPRLVAAVAPRVVVHSAGWRNRWGFPRAVVVGRYRGQGAAQRITGRDGAVTLRFRGTSELEVSTERDRWRAWREP